jgi:RNA polymerase sigma-70 factor, ECF subfamily
MVEKSDAELIAQHRQGDDQAFKELVIKYQRPVYNLALRMTHSRTEAEEICQVVFVKIFEKLDSFNTDFSFFSWLYRIAMNESINALKSRRRQFSLDAARMVAEPFPSFELSEAIQEALMHLQPRDRAMIIFRHFHNLGYQDIAYILDISEKKVKAHLFTARRALKQILTSMGVTNEE